MALSGSVTTGEMQGRSMSFQWSAWQSITSNCSVINWKVVATGSYPNGVKIHEITAKINGQQVYHTDNYGQNVSAGTVIASGTWYQTHNADGTGSFNAYIGAGIYYQWQINTENSANFTLDRIARASSITISNDGLYLGDKAVITISAADASFTHDVSFTWGGYSQTIATGKSGKTIYIDFSPPEATLASYIPNDTVGYGTLKCITYSNGTQIGTSEKVFYGKIKESVIPTLDSLEMSLVNDNSSIHGWGIAVSGYTKVKLTAAAAGALGSTIKSYEVNSKNVDSVSLDYTSDFLSNGDVTFTVRAVDSRGRKSVEQTKTLHVYPYAKPTIASFNAKRDSTEKTKVVISTDWSFDSIDNHNSVSAKVRYKLKISTEWTDSGTAIIPGNTTLSESFDASKSYDFMLILTDFVGSEVTALSRVSTQDVLLDFKPDGTALGIGKYAEADSTVDINEDWNLNVHGKEVLDLIDERATTQADASIEMAFNAYKPAIVETVTVNGIGYQFMWLNPKAGYELVSVKVVQDDLAHTCLGISYRSNDLYTLKFSENIASDKSIKLRLTWIKA